MSENLSDRTTGLEHIFFFVRLCKRQWGNNPFGRVLVRACSTGEPVQIFFLLLSACFFFVLLRLVYHSRKASLMHLCLYAQQTRPTDGWREKERTERRKGRNSHFTPGKHEFNILNHARRRMSEREKWSKRGVGRNEKTVRPNKLIGTPRLSSLSSNLKDTERERERE